MSENFNILTKWWAFSAKIAKKWVFAPKCTLATRFQPANFRHYTMHYSASKNICHNTVLLDESMAKIEYCNFLA